MYVIYIYVRIYITYKGQHGPGALCVYPAVLYSAVIHPAVLYTLLTVRRLSQECSFQLVRSYRPLYISAVVHRPLYIGCYISTVILIHIYIYVRVYITYKEQHGPGALWVYPAILYSAVLFPAVLLNGLRLPPTLDKH